MPKVVLIKFGSSEHMKSLVQHGEMYMNSFSFFREAEGDELRHDIHEGVERILQAQGGLIKTKDPHTGEDRVVASITKATLWESSSELEVMKLYCMFGVDVTGSLETHLMGIDKRIFKGFGDTMVIFTNLEALIERVRRSAEFQGVHVKFGPVRYIDYSAHTGDAGPFVKSDKYSFQKEIRFVAYGGEPKKPLRLMLGDLSDITLLLPSSDAPRLSFKFGAKA